MNVSELEIARILKSVIFNRVLRRLNSRHILNLEILNHFSNNRESKMNKLLNMLLLLIQMKKIKKSKKQSKV